MSKTNLFRRKLEIVEVPMGTLVEAATNTRKHSPSQIRKIADSMKAFGVTTAVLRDADNVVIAGAGRLAALKLLGATTVADHPARRSHRGRAPCLFDCRQQAQRAEQLRRDKARARI